MRMQEAAVATSEIPARMRMSLTLLVYPEQVYIRSVSGVMQAKAVHGRMTCASVVSHVMTVGMA